MINQSMNGFESNTSRNQEDRSSYIEKFPNISTLSTE